MRIHPAFRALPLLLASWLGAAVPGAAPAEIKRFPAEGEPGIARAVRVGDVPLAHTGIMLGWNADGVVRGDARAQAVQALKNAETALRLVGGSLERAVKVHVYVRREEHSAAVDAALAELFRGRPVAVAYVTSELVDSAALVGVDVIAAASPAGAGVVLGNSRELPAPAAGAQVSVLPAGRRIFLSGQAHAGPDLRGATRTTMERLGQTLEWLEAKKTDVVQVKAFLRPFGAHREVAGEVKAFFAGGPVPPVLLVEWANPGSHTEIEMLVAGGAREEEIPGGIAFLTPPGMSASPRFARIAIVDAGHPLIYISGLYGRTAGSGRREWLEIFGQLADILWETGSSMRHQVKGFYYSRTPESRRLHGSMRDVFLDPARPPASSGMLTRGTGRPGRDSTIDMIAIPIPATK